MKNLFKKLTSGLLLTGLLLPTALVLIPSQAEAQRSFGMGGTPFGTPRPSGTITVPVTRANPGTPTTPATPPAQPNFFAPGVPRPYQQQNANQALSQVRADDSRQCLEESQGRGGGGSGGAFSSRQLLQPFEDVVRDAVTLKGTPDALEQTFVNANGAIQREFRSAFTQNITTALKDKFPITLAQKIQALRASGFNGSFEDPEGQGRFRNLINESIRDTLPEVFNDDIFNRSISTAVRNGLQGTVGDALTVSFRDLARPIVEAQYGIQIEGMVQAIPQMLDQRFKEIQGTLESTKDALTAVQSYIQKCFSNPISCALDGVTAILQLFNGSNVTGPPEFQQLALMIEEIGNQITITKEMIEWIAQLDINQLKEDMITNLAFELEQSITAPANINRLGDQIIDAMEGPLNASLQDGLKDITASLTGPIAAVEEAIDNMDEAFLNPIINEVDFQINAAVGAVNATTDTIIDHVSGEITTLIDREIGGRLYPLALNITGGAGGAGEWVAGGIRGVGNNVQDFFYPPMSVEIIPESLRGTTPLAAGQMYEGDYNQALAAGGVVEIMPNGTVSGATPPAAGAPPQVTLNNYTENLFATGGNNLGDPAASPSVMPLDNVTTDTAGAVSGQVTANSERAVTGAISKQTSPTLSPATKSIINSATGAASTVVADMLKTGNPIVDLISGQVVKYAFTAASEAIFGEAINAGASAAGVTTAAVSVPVTEVGGVLISSGLTAANTGEILASNNAIKDMTGKILQLQVESCTHLKVIQRVQLAMEERELYGDRKAREAAATAIRNYYEEKLKFIREGREIKDGEMGSFTPNNITARKIEEIQKATDVMLEILREKGGPFAEDTASALESEADNADEPTLTTEERARLGLIPQTESSNSAFATAKKRPSFWQRLLGQVEDGAEETSTTPNELDLELFGRMTSNPNNYAVGSYVAEKAKLERLRSEMVNNVMTKLGWGQGFEGVEGVTPPSIQRAEIEALTTSIIRQMENVQKFGLDVNKGDLPVQSKINENFLADPEGTLAPEPPAYNCPSPGACPPLDESAFSN